LARYEDLLDAEPLAPKKRGWRGFIWRHLLAVTTALLVALLMIVVLWPYVVITVPSGRVGVYWKRINGFCRTRRLAGEPRQGPSDVEARPATRLRATSLHRVAGAAVLAV
jgi:hypothetical protein